MSHMNPSICSDGFCYISRREVRVMCETKTSGAMAVGREDGLADWSHTESVKSATNMMSEMGIP